MLGNDMASVPAAVRRGGSAALWYGLFGGAAAWFIALSASYFLVTPACSSGSELVLHLVYAIALVAAAGAALAGAALWRRSDGRWPDDGGGRRDRTRFLAAVGGLLSSLLTLVIAAQWLAAIIHAPCRPAPRLPDSPDALVDPSRMAPAAQHARGSCVPPFAHTIIIV